MMKKYFCNCKWQRCALTVNGAEKRWDPSYPRQLCEYPQCNAKFSRWRYLRNGLWTMNQNMPNDPMGFLSRLWQIKGENHNHLEAFCNLVELNETSSSLCSPWLAVGASMLTAGYCSHLFNQMNKLNLAHWSRNVRHVFRSLLLHFLEHTRAQLTSLMMVVVLANSQHSPGALRCLLSPLKVHKNVRNYMARFYITLGR